MAVQVINDPYRSLSGSIGASLGTGLGQGLQALAQQKIDQLQKQSRSKAYEDLGYSRSEASALTALPEKIQAQYLKEYGPQAPLPQQMQPQMKSQQSQNLGQTFQALEQQPQEGNLQGLFEALGALKPKNLGQEIAMQQGNQFLSPEQNQEAINRYVQSALQQPQRQQPQPSEIKRESVGLNYPEINDVLKKQKLMEGIGATGERRLGKTEAKSLREESRREREVFAKEQALLQKHNEPFLKDLDANYKIDKEIVNIVDDLMKLEKSGAIPQTFWNYLASPESIIGKKAIHELSPEAQEYYALAKRLAIIKAQKGIPSKARLLAEEASKPQNYMHPQARQKLIKHYEKEALPTVFQDQAREEILGKTNGLYPRNFIDLVKRRGAELQNQYEQQRKTVEQKELPKGFEQAPENKLFRNPETGGIFMKINGNLTPVEKVGNKYKVIG